MRKKLKEQAIRLTSIVKHVTRETILPFTEKPSVEHEDEEKNAKEKLCASDLFSLFTADIIKEEVVFTR